jgi:hypothetical protein
MKQLTYLLLGILTFSSCNRHKEKSTGQKIVLPGQVEIYNPFLTKTPITSPLNNNNVKIYTLVDVSCSTCLLKLEKWDKFQDEVQQYHVTVVPICFAKDSFEILKYLFENNQIGKVSLPLVLDLKDEFIRQNRALISDIGELTVLTDADNNILFSGDLLDDQTVKAGFIRKIRNLD